MTLRLNLTICGADQHHPTHEHTCVGTSGHYGAHWCQLGHTWTDGPKEEEA